MINRLLRHRLGSAAVVLLLFPLFCSFLLTERSEAQFSGEVHFKAYETMDPEIPERSYRFITVPGRLYLESSHTHRIYAGLHADRFLVRGDREDFVFLNRDDEALAISRQETETLARLVRQMRGGRAGSRSEFDWERQAEETGRTQSIHGFRAEEIRVNSEEPGRFVSVWLTREIRVEWGLLEQVWRDSMSEIIDVDLPMELFMNRNSFPLLVEYFEDEVRTSVVESVKVVRGRVDSARLEIPGSAKQLGLSDLMLRLMRGRR